MTRTALAALAAVAAVLAAPTAARADDPAYTRSASVQACVDAHPGAVDVTEVTDGPDLVCVDDVIAGSPGDDTYLWVPSDESTGTLRLYLPLGNYPAYVQRAATDDGQDTLSLADWTSPFDGASPWGTRISGLDASETTVLTPLADEYNPDQDPTTCATGDVNHTTISTGAGDDTVYCVAANVVTGPGDDTVAGLSADSTVSTGSGDDTVTGDAGVQTVRLGSGADSANVRGGGADTVYGGKGADTVRRSANDVVHSARR